eukprot:Colp12_sorted_trinity150504_noHs@7846
MAQTMDIVFLGTCSAMPTTTRNMSCTAIRMDASVWMFDCGEGTQHQLLKSQLKLGKVERIFITHLHGDHMFGLPGLLCTLSGAASENAVVQVVGPVGLKQYLMTALHISRSVMGTKLEIVELHFDSSTVGQPCHIPEGAITFSSTDLLRDPQTNLWHIPIYDERLTVVAGEIKHSIPSLGYILQEVDQPGKLEPKLVIPHLERNKKALIETGIKNPMSLLSNLKDGKPINLPDGTIIEPKDVLGPRRAGRKIVVLGDTSDASALFDAAADCDVLIHECTNAWLEADQNRADFKQSKSQSKSQNGKTPTPDDTDKESKRPGRSIESCSCSQENEEVAIEHGHSTPEIAGRAAKATKARMLLMNHFSARYKGDESAESLTVMKEIEQLAKKEAGEGCEVIAARDFMTVSVKSRAC